MGDGISGPEGRSGLGDVEETGCVGDGGETVCGVYGEAGDAVYFSLVEDAD